VARLSFLFAKRARWEYARSMRAVKASSAIPYEASQEMDKHS